ncbi:MAG: hypothetical protein ACYCPT_02055 [Acidimicrobiales bacterium]
MSSGKPPRILRDIERDVGSDLRKVGGLFKKLALVSDRGEEAIRVLTREEPAPAEPIARIADGTEVLPKCQVCNDAREVGAQKKVPCPACTKK